MSTIAAIIFLVLVVICALKESKTTGLYKTYGVYGRLTAYLAMDMALVGVMLPVMSVVPSMRESAGMGVVGGILTGLICLAVAGLLFWRALRKCPEFLKSKCIISMLISGLGVTGKLAVFFVWSIWKMDAPKAVTDASGNELYVVGGEVYDKFGNHKGTVTGAGEYRPK